MGGGLRSGPRLWVREDVGLGIPVMGMEEPWGWERLGDPCPSGDWGACARDGVGSLFRVWFPSVPQAHECRCPTVPPGGVQCGTEPC